MSLCVCVCVCVWGVVGAIKQTGGGGGAIKRGGGGASAPNAPPMGTPLATRTARSKSSAASALYGRLSIVLVRAIARAILARSSTVFLTPSVLIKVYLIYVIRVR